VQLEPDGAKLVPVSAPDVAQAGGVAYRNGWWQVAGEEAQGGSATLRDIITDVRKAHMPIDRCIRLLWQDHAVHAWLQHCTAVVEGLRAPVTRAPVWYDAWLIAILSIRRSAENARLQAASKPK
jgi:hypothetical protein